MVTIFKWRQSGGGGDDDVGRDDGKDEEGKSSRAATKRILKSVAPIETAAIIKNAYFVLSHALMAFYGRAQKRNTRRSNTQMPMLEELIEFPMQFSSRIEGIFSVFAIGIT